MLYYRKIQVSILLKISSPYSLRHFNSYYLAAMVPGKEKEKKKKDRLKEGRNKKRPHQKSFNRRERYLLQENNTAVTASRTELRGLGQCSSQDPSRKQHPQTGELKKSFKRGYLQDIEGVGRVKR